MERRGRKCEQNVGLASQRGGRLQDQWSVHAHALLCFSFLENEGTCQRIADLCIEGQILDTGVSEFHTDIVEAAEV